MQQSPQQFPSRVNRTAEEMYKLIAGHKSSDLTVKEYCERNNLAPGTYYYWQKKYQANNDASATAQSGFMLLQVQDTLQQKGLFAEVKGIKLYREVPASYLKELLS
jgi:hypothetical protein